MHMHTEGLDKPEHSCSLHTIVFYHISHGEVLLLSTNNICLHGEIKNNINPQNKKLLVLNRNSQ